MGSFLSFSKVVSMEVRHVVADSSSNELLAWQHCSKAEDFVNNLSYKTVPLPHIHACHGSCPAPTFLTTSPPPPHWSLGLDSCPPLPSLGTLSAVPAQQMHWLPPPSTPVLKPPGVVTQTFSFQAPNRFPVWQTRNNTNTVRGKHTWVGFTRRYQEMRVVH